jgi:hypothetical protein
MKTFNKVLMVLSVSFGLAACGPDGGHSTADAGDWVGHPPADGGMPAGTAQFRGAWKYESLEALITCSDGTQTPFNEVSGTETFTQGADGDEVIGIDQDGCRSTCRVSGNTADCQTDTSSNCGGGGIAIGKDVYTYSGGKLSEYTTGQLVTSDGLDCSIVGTATLTFVK